VDVVDCGKYRVDDEVAAAAAVNRDADVELAEVESMAELACMNVILDVLVAGRNVEF
jgi:hypothetical protein